MQIDFTRPLYSLKRKPLTEDGEPLTIGIMLAAICVVVPGQGEKLSANERAKRFVLAIKITDSTDPLELDDADVKLLKSVVEASSNLTPLCSEQILATLEGKDNPLAPKEDSPT